MDADPDTHRPVTQWDTTARRAARAAAPPKTRTITLTLDVATLRDIARAEDAVRSTGATGIDPYRCTAEALAALAMSYVVAGARTSRQTILGPVAIIPRHSPARQAQR